MKWEPRALWYWIPAAVIGWSLFVDPTLGLLLEVISLGLILGITRKRRRRDPQPSTDQLAGGRTTDRDRALVVLGAAALVGISAWAITMARAPRYSQSPNEDLGDFNVFVIVLVVAALIAGFILEDDRRGLALALVLPSVMLAPWTTPRGDDDGLWTLIFPALGMVAVLLVGVGWLGGRSRKLWSSIASRP